MAEVEQSSRIEREALQLQADVAHRTSLVELQKAAHRGTFNSDLLGQFMGFFVAMTCVGGAIYGGIVQDRPWISAILLSVPVIGIINAVRGMKAKDKPETNDKPQK